MDRLHRPTGALGVPGCWQPGAEGGYPEGAAALGCGPQGGGTLAEPRLPMSSVAAPGGGSWDPLCPQSPSSPQQHPGARGPGGWSPWTIQCLRSGFWVGLAKRAQQEEEVGVGVCFHPSFHACCRLCLSRGPGTRKPMAPRGFCPASMGTGSLTLPWAPQPPCHMVPQCSGQGLSPRGDRLVQSLAGELSVSQMCSQPPRYIHGPSDTEDTGAGEAGHL